jgi:hypothetical protein
VKSIIVLVPTPGESRHPSDLNFDDGPCPDRSKIDITHSGHVPAAIRRATALLGLIDQTIPSQSSAR